MDCSYGDGLIVGGSSLAHLEENLRYCEPPKEGEAHSLPASVLEAFETAWKITKSVCVPYFR